MEEMKLVVEIWPLSMAPNRKEANESPVSLTKFPVQPACVGGQLSAAVDGNAVSVREKFGEGPQNLL